MNLPMSNSVLLGYRLLVTNGMHQDYIYVNVMYYFFKLYSNYQKITSSTSIELMYFDIKILLFDKNKTN